MNMTGRQVIGLLIALGTTVALTAGCGNSSNAQANGWSGTAVAQKREIVVDVSATGTVQAIKVIEIKSKASGEILRLPVETGQVVRAGQLLAQVDTTDVAAQVRQAVADLDVSRARLTLTARKKERSDDLLRQGMMSQDEYDQAVLDYQTAVANVIKSQTALDQAQERMSETDVRAPSSGTILTKSVEEGQIIASAISQVSGGTTLMTMADLGRVEVRVLVDETDFGKVRPGQMVTVTVDAYPNRQFFGTIEKIEPEAETQQSITFFPLLIEIDNEDGLLKPGMSADVDIHVLTRDNVLSVPNETVKSIRSAILTAPLLGLDPDSVSAIVSAPPERPNRAAMGDSAGQGRQPRFAMRPAGTGRRRSEAGQRPGGPPGAGSAQPAAGGSQMTMRSDAHMAVVFAQRNGSIVPVVVRTGVQNWDYTEILAGIAEGEHVIVPPSATIAQESQQTRERAQRFGGGVMGRR